MEGIHNYEGQLKRQKEKLDSDVDADTVAEADRDAILRFIDEKNLDGKAVSSLRDYTHRLRIAANEADKPLTEFESVDDAIDLVMKIKREREYADNTMNNVRSTLRKFWRERCGFDWAEDFTTGKRVNTSEHLTKDDLLNKDEIDDLLDAATNPRDKALIALLLDTGQRIGAIGTLEIGDVEFNERYGEIRLNEDAIGLKGASGKRPITWSMQYVRNWLDVHPRKDEDDAPLFCTLPSTTHGEPGTPVQYQQLRRRLMVTAERAGIDKEKVSPHNFRHTAITRMWEDGFSESQIKYIAGWSKDSSQFEVYANVSDEDMMKSVLEERGLIENDDTFGEPTIETCWRCSHPARGDFCQSCGAALNQQAADRVSNIEQGMKESYKEVDPEDTDTQEKIDALDELLDDPDVKAALLEKLTEE